MTSCYLPEGRLLNTPVNTAACATADALSSACASGAVLEGEAILCDEAHNLIVKVGPFTGIIPRPETALGVREGTTRDIAILSRVGKPVCFTVQSLDYVDGVLTPLLSRRKAQQLALGAMLEWTPGQVIGATVTHLESFGAFVDVGCGVSSMIGVERLSVSRISHPKERLRVGQEIYAAVLQVDAENRRVSLTHRELLGTWAENAALFRPGMTVPGHVRGVKDYGVFVELTANLSGLAEAKPGLTDGDRVSVYIKSILSEKRKLKLLIIDTLPPLTTPEPPRYFITGGVLTHWRYAPQDCEKPGGETIFTAP